jgi:UDP-2,4-diacetamido-2,4,6-trideoxy-beta-L-altropyranose hydrolase
MNVLIRVDASLHIGNGHVMRCLVLAGVLRNKGHNIVFVSRAQKGDLIHLIEKKFFKVLRLKSPAIWKEPSHSADYAAWLQVTINDDIDDFLNQTRLEKNEIDLVIVDHYAINEHWELVVKKALRCKIFSLDDLVRRHTADLILDPTLFRSLSEYKQLNPNAEILVGCENAILNPQFSKQRELVLNLSENEIEHKLLVSMGTDSKNVTLEVLKVIKNNLSLISGVTVIMNINSPGYRDLNSFAKTNKAWLTHVDFIEDMAALLMDHTLAIGAPGTASWERVCLGVPSIIIPLADNQLSVSNSLVKANVAICIAEGKLLESLNSSLMYLITDWYSMRENCLKLCDGLGVYKVADKIHEICNINLDKLTIRHACKADIEVVYSWQTHPNTRKFSLNKDVPSSKEHQKWMCKKMASTEDFFYIICLGDGLLQVGVVRLDRIKDEEYILSIYISPQYYRKGIAKRALALIDIAHPDITCFAKVLNQNTASKKLFLSAKYKQKDSGYFVRKPIN